MNEQRRGTSVFFNKSIFSPMGWEMFLRKYEGTKIFRPDIQSIKWIETNEQTMEREFIHIHEINNSNDFHQESSIRGENAALKNEIEHLRKELSQALSKLLNKG